MFALNEIGLLRSVLGKNRSKIVQVQWVASYDWYVDSKGNSDANLVSIKDFLAKENEPTDRLKQEQTRLLFLVDILLSVILLPPYIQLSF